MNMIQFCLVKLNLRMSFCYITKNILPSFLEQSRVFRASFNKELHQI